MAVQWLMEHILGLRLLLNSLFALLLLEELKSEVILMLHALPVQLIIVEVKLVIQEVEPVDLFGFGDWYGLLLQALVRIVRLCLRVVLSHRKAHISDESLVLEDLLRLVELFFGRLGVWLDLRRLG